MGQALPPHITEDNIYGDVNGDGAVDIADVNEVINVMLGRHDNGNPETRNAKTYTINGVSFEMITIEGGTFVMGQTAEQGSGFGNAALPVHQVTLSDYSIARTEVTQELWVAVMGYNPSYYNGDYHRALGKHTDYGENLQRPLDSATWYECQIFIDKLNELTGEKFRLPTEAEWEYAARGGKYSKGYMFAGGENIDNIAWHYENSATSLAGGSEAGRTTHEVGKKDPNELGLFDMSGNVFEWCQDWYGDYSDEPQTNPTGPASGRWRVTRGGSLQASPDGCRVSSRDSYGLGPSYTSIDVGFRLAL